jgi:hypothetical protein
MKMLIRLVPGFIFLSLFLLLVSCGHHQTLFEPVLSDVSGIHFNNRIIENDSINELDIENVYNGGGVGIGDFNHDGLQDIYFTGNQTSNKLYLNKGDFKFDDITDQAGVGGAGRWCRGVAVVDINNDGWPDIYVCATIKKDPDQRKNLLYINQGTDKQGIPHFKEVAGDYGLADNGHSTQAAFFDYDNDGDLDVYIVTNEINKDKYPDAFRPIVKDGSNPSTGRLYRNDWSDSLKHPVFTDVSKQAGIQTEGYGHSINITDINNDGWKDIYITNDFITNDLLWINNHDGTFSEQLNAYFKHTSANAMGQDIEDINNDGLPDVVVLDMNPGDNFRKKMMLGGNNYRTYQNTERFGYGYQYVRNTLQLNQGPSLKQNDSVGNPIFSDIAFHAGIAETDWSWTPMVVDFDNDGYRDIIITNGFPKDVSDHDFAVFRQKANLVASKQQLLSQIPEVKLHKYAYRNNGDLGFTDVSAAWGLTAISFSNGAAYADLDNDGDLDVIINNIDDEASVYRNMAREKNDKENHYLNIRFSGDSLNKNGIGAWAELHYDHGKQQVYENTPFRGYLSTVQDIAHFGLGKNLVIDSVIIKWPDGKMQLLKNVKTDQVMVVNVHDADRTYSLSADPIASNTLFREITDSVGIHYQQQERDYIDFNVQKLLPHKFSEYGPSIAVGDLDGNGFDDIVSGGSAYNSTSLFFQQPDGRFIEKELITEAEAKGKTCDDLGVLLFDADGDGDLDLYIAGGGYENEHNSPAYQDHLYINDGKGNFSIDSTALPKNFTSKFCVRAADFDHDGDLDLFISGRVDPGNYPKPVSSFIYRNDSRNGHIQFTDVTQSVAKDLLNIGMVCDALWTDFDNDGWPDLVLAGEWMPVTFLKNNKGIFTNITESTGISNQKGWWNSITSGDFDQDGDIDYVIGNLGQNSFYRAGEKYPVRVYGKDFDNNGIYDMIPSLYLPDTEGGVDEFPAQGRDDLLKQINAMRKKFPTYKSYALANMNVVLTDAERKGALILEANNFQTSLIRNDGNGKFSVHPMPVQAQLSVINGMVTDDFDGDGNLDIIMNGNDYGTEPFVGRYDALNGLFLKGDGKGNFNPETILQSGIYIPGNGKALVKLRNTRGGCLLAAGQNRGSLKVFRLKKNQRIIPIAPMDVKARIAYKTGKTIEQEFYYGSSFLSESGRFLLINDQVTGIEVTDNKGVRRKLNL